MEIPYFDDGKHAEAIGPDDSAKSMSGDHDGGEISGERVRKLHMKGI